MEDLLAKKLEKFCDSFLSKNQGIETLEIVNKQKTTKNSKLEENSNDILNKPSNTVTKLNKDISEIKSCDNLSSQKKVIKKKKRKLKKSSKEVKKNDNKSSSYTDDGFRITNYIPPDDSDISDAFEEEDDVYKKKRKKMSSLVTKEEKKKFNANTEGKSCTDNGFKITKYISPDDSEEDDETNLSSGNGSALKMTEDGFKIINHIPSDDSDVSDAFTNDGELDLDSLEKVENKSACHTTEDDTDKTKAKYKPSIQKLIDDFGIDMKKVFNGKKKETINNTTTKSTLASKDKEVASLQIVDYSVSRKRKVKAKDVETEVESIEPIQSTNTNENEKAFKKARYDVFKYGMTGFDKEKKTSTQIALAISLGAKPPKKKYVNYKEFQVQKVNERAQQKEETETKQKLGLKVSKPTEKKKKDSNHVRGFGTLGGRYQEGRMILSKTKIAKMKGKS